MANILTNRTRLSDLVEVEGEDEDEVGVEIEMWGESAKIKPNLICTSVLASVFSAKRLMRAEAKPVYLGTIIIQLEGIEYSILHTSTSTLRTTRFFYLNFFYLDNSNLTASPSNFLSKSSTCLQSHPQVYPRRLAPSLNACGSLSRPCWRNSTRVCDVFSLGYVGIQLRCSGDAGQLGRVAVIGGSAE